MGKNASKGTWHCGKLRKRHRIVNISGRDFRSREIDFYQLHPVSFDEFFLRFYSDLFNMYYVKSRGFNTKLGRFKYLSDHHFFEKSITKPHA